LASEEIFLNNKRQKTSYEQFNDATLQSCINLVGTKHSTLQYFITSTRHLPLVAF